MLWHQVSLQPYLICFQQRYGQIGFKNKVFHGYCLHRLTFRLYDNIIWWYFSFSFHNLIIWNVIMGKFVVLHRLKGRQWSKLLASYFWMQWTFPFNLLSVTKTFMSIQLACDVSRISLIGKILSVFVWVRVCVRVCGSNSLCSDSQSCYPFRPLKCHLHSFPLVGIGVI